MIRNYELYSVLKLNLISMQNYCINSLYFKWNIGILASFLTFPVLAVQVQPWERLVFLSFLRKGFVEWWIALQMVLKTA